MSKRVKRDPSFQAKLMVESFGVDRALRFALDARSKATKDLSYWNEVIKGIRTYLPMPPPPVYPSMDKMERNVQEWAASVGAVLRIDKDSEMVVLPLKQRLFGYVQQ